MQMGVFLGVFISEADIVIPSWNELSQLEPDIFFPHYPNLRDAGFYHIIFPRSTDHAFKTITLHNKTFRREI